MTTVKWMPNGKNKSWIQLDIVSCEWSGTENQAARQLQFTVPWNPYYKDFSNYKIALGDRVSLYDGSKLLFLGVITSRERTSTIGTTSYSAYDYMHYLLRGTTTKSIKNTTAKKATKTLCKLVGVKVGKLQDPKVNIKAVYKDKSIYDIIVALYRKAYKFNKKKYMPVMSGDKFSVIIKGQDTGIVLDQEKDILSASYHDTTDNMVNHVDIYNDGNKKKGTVKNQKQINRYGTYMKAYTMKEDEKYDNAKTAANNLMVGITKEASVEAIGYVKCVAGRSLKINDKATGITGKFYITSDSHSFHDGIHTMKLELSKSNIMETGAQAEKNSKGDDDD